MHVAALARDIIEDYKRKNKNNDFPVDILLLLVYNNSRIINGEGEYCDY